MRARAADDPAAGQIVAGRRPMSDLRAYRKEWHRRGGDQIIAEYRRALDTNG